MPRSLQDPRPGIEPGPFAVEAWSPNHWTTREFPLITFIITVMIVLNFYYFYQVYKRSTSWPHEQKILQCHICPSEPNWGVYYINWKIHSVIHVRSYMCCPVKWQHSSNLFEWCFSAPRSCSVGRLIHCVTVFCKSAGCHKGLSLWVWGNKGSWIRLVI